MSRQERFEQAYAEAHDLPVETFAQYRMGDTYRLPLIAKCWRFWNAALDAEVNEFVNGKKSKIKPVGLMTKEKI